jgi:hypothetical protein
MFETKFNEIINLFGNRFITVKCANNQKITWPKGFGVYLVWENKPNEAKRLIYIGMTGKFIRSKGNISANNGRFSSRKVRWTPYYFSEDSSATAFNEFRYGPKYSNSNTQRINKLEQGAYANSIAYDFLELNFFIFQPNPKDNFSYSPSSLESTLLTAYLLSNNDLPPANNEL